jgi:uncharacterized protein
MNVRRSAIAFGANALIASSPQALDIPPKPTQWVNDYAHTLNDSQVQQLNEKLEGFYKRDGVQFLIMIFPSLEGEDDLGYTNKVANVWKVKDDKALLLFVFMKEHKTRIQVGYSMEPVITDAFSSDVVHNTIPPFFRAGDFAGGLNAAVDQIAGKIDPNFVSTSTTPAPQRRRARSSKSPEADMFFPSIFVLFVIFVLIPLLARGRRRGGCGGCFWPMMFLGGGGGGTTFGGGGGSGWSTGGSWGGGGSSFGGGGAGGGW